MEELCVFYGWDLVVMDVNVGFGGGVNVGVVYVFEVVGVLDLFLFNFDVCIDVLLIVVLFDVIFDGMMFVLFCVEDVEGRIWFVGMDVYFVDGLMGGLWWWWE